MSETTLRPCPFCGGKAYTKTDGYTFLVMCLDCGMNDESNNFYQIEKEAINEWNTRITDPVIV